MKGRVFGGKCSESLANYNLGSLSWRTSQRSLFEGYQKYSGRWPRTGMMQSGQLFLLRNVERPTEGTGYSSLPTPCASDAWNEKDSRKRFNRPNSPDYNEKKANNPSCQNLYTAVTKLLPTPKKHIGECPVLNPQFVEHMMGFPIGWTSLEHSETPSCLNAQNGSEEE